MLKTGRNTKDFYVKLKYGCKGLDIHFLKIDKTLFFYTFTSTSPAGSDSHSLLILTEDITAASVLFFSLLGLNEKVCFSMISWVTLLIL